MSTFSFKNLHGTDRTTSRTLLHENIPITGTIISGTYNTSSTSGREDNIKTFSHGMFQSVYDYPYVSSSANHIFDITAGFSTSTGSLSSSAVTQVSKKVNIYNQMAQVLCGYDTASNIHRFDTDGNLQSVDGDKHEDAIFFNFSRLLVKDEIKKGSFSMVVGTGATYASPFADKVTITDTDAANNYRSNSPAGEFGLLKNGTNNVGLVYYQAGIAILSSSAFGTTEQFTQAGLSATGSLLSSSIDEVADAVRNRIQNISFNNTTELNSSIYFCRANHNEFNYSSNPTYLSGSKIRVKTNPGTVETENLARAYITTVGLYSHDNQLLAVAKLSEPLRKDPTNELTLRVRLDF